MKHKVSEMLTMLDQAHLVQYMQGLSAEAQLVMAKQVETLDLSVLDETGEEKARGKLEPLYAVRLAEIMDDKRLKELKTEFWESPEQ